MHAWMTAPRCFATLPELNSGPLELCKEEGRHLSRVRRITLNNPISVLNGQGQVGLGVIQDIDRDRVTVHIDEVMTVTPARPEITLVIGALKQTAWDELLKHAVELGVNRVVRFQSRHAVSELKADKEDKKRQRWQEIMREACKQSGNTWLPSLVFADDVGAVFDHMPGNGLQLLAGLSHNPLSLHESLPNPLPENIGVWVGPEGDFSAREMDEIVGAGAKVVSLGERVLRAETAALSMLAHLRLLS